MEIHLNKLMPLVRREGLMPPTAPGNKYETLRALYEYVVQSIGDDDEYKLELLGPDFMAHVPTETWVRRIAIEHPEWREMSLYDRGALLAVKRIEGWERVINHHLEMQRSRKKKSGFKTMDETFGKTVRKQAAAKKQQELLQERIAGRAANDGTPDKQHGRKKLKVITSTSDIDSIL